MVVRYDDYKRFGAEATITFGEAVGSETAPDKQPETKPEEQKKP
jgi:hypothetical protein